MALRKSTLLSQRVVIKQLTDESRLAAAGRDSFIRYAEKWWDEVAQNPKIHKKRLIKIFVEIDDREG